MDSPQDQLGSALERLADLQHRINGPLQDPPRLLRETVRALGCALEELRVAQEQVTEQGHALEFAQVSLQRERKRYWQLFDAAPDAYLVTGPDSLISEANRAAAILFNISQRFLVGKALSLFVCGERGRFLGDAAQLSASGGNADWILRVRPRERAPVEVSARVVASDDDDEQVLHWMLRRADVTVAPISRTA